MSALAAVASEPSHMAALKAALRVYEPGGLLESAFAALPERIENLPMNEVQKWLKPHDAEIALHAIPDRDVDAVVAGENSERTFFVEPHGKHPAPRVDLGDGAAGHGDPSSKVAASGGHAPDPLLLSAWTRLSKHANREFLADVPNLLRSHCAEVAPDFISDGNADVAPQREHGKNACLVQAQQKSASRFIDQNDGPGGHGESSSVQSHIVALTKPEQVRGAAI